MYTPLHRELGLTAGKITSNMVNEAIDLNIRETKDLDFKAQPPTLKELAKSDLPKDIAAMANSGGGVILYGVSEDSESGAARRVDLNGRIGHDFQQAVSRLAATKISPPVLDLQMEVIDGPPGPALAVVIPPSRQIPHSIDEDRRYRVPVRTGPHTTWLSEPEIARLYRDRFNFALDAKQALDQLYDRTKEQKLDAAAWFVGIAIPQYQTLRNNPSQTDAQILGAKARDNRARYSGQGAVTPLSNTYNAGRRGLRSWRFSTLDGRDSDPALAVFHDDGSVQILMRITSNGEHSPENHVEMPLLELCVVDLIFATRELAQNSGHGEYDIKIGVEWDDVNFRNFSYPPGYQRHFNESSISLRRFYPIESSLNVLASDSEFSTDLWNLVVDCVNQAGYMRPRHIPSPEEN